MAVREFSSQLDTGSEIRSIDADAPFELRQEFIDVMYRVFERTHDYNERRLYSIVVGSLGIAPTGNPYGGFRYAIGRDIKNTPWQRFYDLIIRLGAEVPGVSVFPEYRDLVNRLLAAHRIAWELGENNKLHRVVPVAVSRQIEGAFLELNQTRFTAALASFQGAMAAYDDRPQGGKDACKNMFDALESVAKVVATTPDATFGDVLKDIRKSNFLATETLSSLQKLYDTANAHFRHGQTEPFALKAAEVDYFLTSFVGAILLFIRL